MKLTFEDFQPGNFGTFGPRHVTREEIIAFATEYDPQPMHLSDEAGKASLLGGLAGSGWHMCALMMRILCDGILLRAESLGAPGVDEMKWLAPLFPGDDLTVDVDVLSARVSKSRPELGIVTLKCVMKNASGTSIAEMTTPLMIRRRSVEPVS